MPLPAFALPVAAVAALGGLYFYKKNADAEKAAAAAKAKAAAPAVFPPELVTDLTNLLNAPPDQDPVALERVAVKLEALGFKEQATSLRLKAAKLRAATPFTPGVM